MHEVLEQLERPEDEFDLRVDGKTLHLSHLAREMWPGVTKRDLLIYYASVGKWMLPHLRGRPLGFVQYPKGLCGPRKFERHWWAERTPEFIQRVEIFSIDKGEATVHLLANDLPSLLWFAQISAYELHPWYSHADRSEDYATSEAVVEASKLNHPDFLVIDLDPNVVDAADAWTMTNDAAFALKSIFDGLKLTCYVKTSGKSGIHLFVPIKSLYPYDAVRSMAEAIARSAVALAPDLMTIERRVAHRPSRVYVDYEQNVRAKTLVAPYSPRETLGATVSMPLDWKKLQHVRPADFDMNTVRTSLSRHGDVWREILDAAQEIG